MSSRVTSNTFMNFIYDQGMEAVRRHVSKESVDGARHSQQGQKFESIVNVGREIKVNAEKIVDYILGSQSKDVKLRKVCVASVQEHCLTIATQLCSHVLPFHDPSDELPSTSVFLYPYDPSIAETDTESTGSSRGSGSLSPLSED